MILLIACIPGKVELCTNTHPLQNSQLIRCQTPGPLLNIVVVLGTNIFIIEIGRSRDHPIFKKRISVLVRLHCILTRPLYIIHFRYLFRSVNTTTISATLCLIAPAIHIRSSFKSHTYRDMLPLRATHDIGAANCSCLLWRKFIKCHCGHIWRFGTGNIYNSFLGNACGWKWQLTWWFNLVIFCV